MRAGNLLRGGGTGAGGAPGGRGPVTAGSKDEPAGCRRAPAAGILLLLLVFPWLPGCAPGPAPRGGPPAAGPACWDLRYRVRFSDGKERGNGRLLARACPDGRLYAEVRGRVGTPVLVAAVREGRVRLLFPRRKEAVDGPDAPPTWQRWTGIPLPGSVLLGRRRGDRGGEREFRTGRWSGTVAWAPAAADPCPFPVRLAARSEEGGLLVAERSGARPAPGPPAWPPVPRGFVHRREGAPAAGDGVPGRGAP